MNWAQIDTIKYEDEEKLASKLMAKNRLDLREQAESDQNAVELVIKARQLADQKGMMESFLEEFGLSNSEGLALMCLAESLLRVPDGKTADKLIAEKISAGDWGAHKGKSENWLVNMSTLGLMLTGSVIDVDDQARKDIPGYMKALTRKAGEPVIRAAMMQAMRIMGEQFVVGRNIEDAMQRAKTLEPGKKPAICSFDMLGEGARTFEDAERYFDNYYNAILALGEAMPIETPPEDKHGISVKLSALHPRYDDIHYDELMKTLYPKIKALAIAAADANINLTLDAEEVDRLVVSLKLFEHLCNEEALGEWAGLGLAVQAYQKRSDLVLEKLIETAKTCRNGKGRKIMIRLVKGAYWDTEIKHAQVMGYPDYAVWTRKPTTDLAYLACARRLLDAGTWVYAQFATHNAHTVATIEVMAAGGHHFEFQRLHGMGDALYAAVCDGPNAPRPCRVYAPVGAHEDLLPYLVRRLLENGANTSFVHSFLDEDVAPEDVAKSPFTDIPPTRHDKIALPPDLYGTARKNSRGIDLTQEAVRGDLVRRAHSQSSIQAGPIVGGKVSVKKGASAVFAPSDNLPIGTCVSANEPQIDKAFTLAKSAFKAWDEMGGKARADILLKAADKLEDKTEVFVALMAREAGKCYEDGISEVREAIEFIRYYSKEAIRQFEAPVVLRGPAGETNSLGLCGRGVFVCISPWNFPLAIFIGQVVAALAAGNTVLAKPAEQTPLVAFEAVKLLQEAGLPKDVLHLLPGDGARVGAALVAHKDVAGVCFTGSTQTAQTINRSLAAKGGPIPVLIAETGGLNAMFVDTSALKEQVVDDVIASAFNAAGQRCSALRILVLPKETAAATISCLKGAMDALVIGDPVNPDTDVGPVIDESAKSGLKAHIEAMQATQTILHALEVPKGLSGSYIAPTLVEIANMDALKKEQFGPILHVIRYTPKTLPKIAQQLADKGYGLTLGVHTRIDDFVREIREMVPAGNCYVNRNIIGAVVGVQPFGGIGLSGTGPKAGGPHYLPRFASERTLTINISATGGDPALLNLD